MSDDKTKSRAQDRLRINTPKDVEVGDWSKKFGVSAEELRTAVESVGHMAKGVEAHPIRSKP